MTKRLWELHSWVGLLCGFGLLLVGLSGALLVFHDEIEVILHPEVVRATPSPSGRLPLDELLARTQRALPACDIISWNIRSQPGSADQVYLTRNGESETLVAYVDPFNGKVPGGATDFDHTFTGWMLNLHYRLFVGEIGVAITGVLALMLCFLALSGFWLYRGFWKHFFRLRWGRSARIFLSDTHKMVGISSVVFNLILGGTGAYFNIIEIASYFQTDEPSTALRPSGRFYSGKISFDLLLREAENKLPGFRASYLALPDGPDGSVIFQGSVPTRNPLRSDYGSTVSFDAKTGLWQRTDDIRRASLLAQVIDTTVPLHFGTFGGVIVKILWCLAGLAPGVLATSGFLIWRRRKAHR